MSDDEQKQNESAVTEEAEKEFWLEHKLKKPINPFGEEMTVLRLRHPTTIEIRRINDPFHSKDGATILDSDLAAVWIEKLGKLPKDGCNMLHWKDFQVVKGEVISFFAESMDASI